MVRCCHKDSRCGWLEAQQVLAGKAEDPQQIPCEQELLQTSSAAHKECKHRTACVHSYLLLCQSHLSAGPSLLDFEKGSSCPSPLSIAKAKLAEIVQTKGSYSLAVVCVSYSINQPLSGRQNTGKLLRARSSFIFKSQRSSPHWNILRPQKLPRCFPACPAAGKGDTPG